MIMRNFSQVTNMMISLYLLSDQTVLSTVLSHQFLALSINFINELKLKLIILCLVASNGTGTDPISIVKNVKKCLALSYKVYDLLCNTLVISCAKFQLNT